MSNWAESMIYSLEEDIERLETIAKNKSKSEKEKYQSMINDMKKQLLPLYRTAIQSGATFCPERLREYEKAHYPKKLFTSDPQLEETSISYVSRQMTKTYSAEEFYFKELEEQELPDQTASIDLSFLSKRQREALELYADGLTYQAIANLMDVKKGTVSKHLQLAKKAIEEKYNNTIQLSLTFDDVDTKKTKTTRSTTKIQRVTPKRKKTSSEQLNLLIDEFD